MYDLIVKEIKIKRNLLFKVFTPMCGKPYLSRFFENIRIIGPFLRSLSKDCAPAGGIELTGLF